MIQYRPLLKRDVKPIQAVALKAWKYTYRNIYSPKTIQRYVSSYYSDESFEKFVLPTTRKGIDSFYVALDGRKLIGYAHVGKRREGWELFRIYLLPRYIGKGIGKRLLHLCERALKRKRAGSYFLFVHSGNKLGKDFYLRNGFVRVKRRDRGSTSLCLEKKLS